MTNKTDIMRKAWVRARQWAGYERLSLQHKRNVLRMAMMTEWGIANHASRMAKMDHVDVIRERIDTLEAKDRWTPEDFALSAQLQADLYAATDADAVLSAAA